MKVKWGLRHERSAPPRKLIKRNPPANYHKTLISREEELPRHIVKHLINDLIAAWYSKHKACSKPSLDEITDLDRTRFCRLVFGGWHTHKDVGEYPILPSRPGSAAGVRIGKWKTDIETTSCQKFEYGGLVPYRQAGGPVYLQVGVTQYGTVSWSCRDKGEWPGPLKEVEFTPGINLLVGKIRAAKRHDFLEDQRVSIYNRDLAIAIARRRIVRYAHRCDARGRLKKDWDKDDLDTPRFLQLILAGEYLGAGVRKVTGWQDWITTDMYRW